MTNTNKKLMREFVNATGDTREIGKQIFEKLRGKFPNVTLGDSEANATQKPEEATFFNFEYTVKGQNFGNVTISVIDDAMKIYYSKNISNNLEGEDLRYWYSFLQEMRELAMTNLLRFDVHDITKDRLSLNDIQTTALRNNGVIEGKMYGSNKSSYQKRGPAKIIVRHSENINPDSKGSRSRKVESIFVETHEGERFKMPFKNVPGARAMCEHISQGGRPYDELGEAISTMVYETAALRPFISRNKNKMFEDETSTSMFEAAKEYYTEARKAIKQLSGKRGYKKFAENFTPVTECGDYDEDSYKSRFNGKRGNERMEAAYPIVHKAYTIKETPLVEDQVNEVIDYGYWDWSEEQFIALGRATRKYMSAKGVNLETGDGYEEFFQQHLDWGVEENALDVMEQLAQPGSIYDAANTLRHRANIQKTAEGISNLIDLIDFDDSMVEALGLGEGGYFDDMPGSDDDFNRDFGGGFDDEEPANDFERWEQNDERQGEINDFMSAGDEYENWANETADIDFNEPVVEGTWAWPNDPRSKQELMSLMQDPLPFGVDGQNASSAIQHLIGDDDLAEQLYAGYQDFGAEADARMIIKKFYNDHNTSKRDPQQSNTDRTGQAHGIQEAPAQPTAPKFDTMGKDELASWLERHKDSAKQGSRVQRRLWAGRVEKAKAEAAKRNMTLESDSEGAGPESAIGRTARSGPFAGEVRKVVQINGEWFGIAQFFNSSGDSNRDFRTKLDPDNNWKPMEYHRGKTEGWVSAITGKVVEGDVDEGFVGKKEQPRPGFKSNDERYWDDENDLKEPDHADQEDDAEDAHAVRMVHKESKATYSDYKNAYTEVRTAEAMIEHLTAQGKTAELKIAEATCKRMADKDNSGLQVNEADLDILHLAGIVQESYGRGNVHYGTVNIELYDPKSNIETEAEIEVKWTYDDGNVGFGTGPGNSPYPDGTWDFESATFSEPMRFRGKVYNKGDIFDSDDFSQYLQNEEALEAPSASSLEDY